MFGIPRGNHADVCPVQAVKEWLHYADIDGGPVFRRINRWGTVELDRLDAATRNVFIQETFDDFHVKWAKDLFDGIPWIKDGYLSVPEGPGIGVSVNEELIDNYPPGERNYMNLFHSGWEQRFKE